MATQVEITNLNSWLQSQAANTVTTPYAIEITGLTSQNVENIRDILRNNSTKYVDLRETQIPFYSTSISSLFLYCSTLVYSPKLPDGVEQLVSTFFQCSNLKEIPDIPSSCNYMSATFYECTSLTEAHISNSLRYMAQCFAGCTSLQKANIPPTYIAENETWYPVNISNTFNGCSSLVEVSISLTKLPIGTQFSIGNHQSTFNNCSNLSTFYSDQPYELKQWLTDNKSDLKLSKNISNYYFRLLSSPAKISINKLNDELLALSENTGSEAYCIKITELQSTSDIATILKDNSTKYVDLSSTELAKNTNMYQFFKDCTTLVAAPVIPKGVTELNGTFSGCTSLVEPPVIPEGVTNLSNMFYHCTALTNAPEIPNGVIDMSATFDYCVSLRSAPTIPNSVTNMIGTFSVCSSLLFVPNIPNSVVCMEKTFQECTSLVEVSSFEADINTLLDNASESTFANCTSLTKIGVPSRIKESSEWHAFRLKFGASTVEGKVYDKTKTSTAISQTAITKTNLKLPILTDELWFPSSGTSDADIDEVIEKAIQYRYTYWNKEVLEPDKKNFVLWADDPDNVMTNITSDIDYPIPVDKGGTGQTTAKGAEYNIIGGVEQVTTAFDDNRYIAVQNQTVSDTNGTFRWFKVSNLWNYIKDKISSILGLTASAYDGKADTAGTSDEAKKLSVATSFGTSAVTYVKVSGILTTGKENVFTLQSREGELLLISAGYGDNSTIKAPKILRLCNAYTKVDGCRLSGSDLIFKVASWSHVCIITQIAGNSAATITTTTTTETEYNNGTAVTIDDVNDASGTAYCTTASATQAKVASMRGYVLQSGATFPITFTNANSYDGVITLNVNSTGAKNIYINNAVSSSSNKTLPAGTYLCRYNGSYYYIDTSYFVTTARSANSATSATDARYLGSGRGAVNGYYIEPSYDSTENWVKMNGHYGTGSFSTRKSCVDVALKIRIGAPSSPSDGDIWLE